jgi:DNA-binding transcriptional MerR regulator
MKHYYISYIIRILDISHKTYYLWEANGKVPKAKRDPMSGYRY